MEMMACQESVSNVASTKPITENAVASCSASLPSSRGKRIFTLRAVNSFGRDETGTVLVDNGKPLKLTSKFVRENQCFLILISHDILHILQQTVFIHVRGHGKL